MKKHKLLVSALLTTVLSGSLIAGATYSLFTSTSTHDITVSSATVNLESSIDTTTLTLSSIGVEKVEGTTFPNGGTATIAPNGKDITLDKMTPGDKVSFKININNTSTVKVKYRVTYALVSTEDTKPFFDALEKTPSEGTGYTLIDALADVDPITVTILLPESANNDYQDKNCTIRIVVEAIQGNAVTEEDIANARTAAIDELQGYFDRTFNKENETKTQAETILTNGKTEIEKLNDLDSIETAKTTCLNNMAAKFATYKEVNIGTAIRDAREKVEAIQGNDEIKNTLSEYINAFNSDSNNFDSMSKVNDGIKAFNKHIEDNIPADLAPVKERVKAELKEYYTNKLNGDISGDSGVYNLYLTIDDAQSEGDISAIENNVRTQIDTNFKLLVDNAKKQFTNIDKGRLDEIFNRVSSYQELQKAIDYCKSLDIPPMQGK